MANLQIVISALNKASGEINKVKSEIKGVGDTGKTAQGGVKGFGSSLLGVVGTAGMVAAAVGAVSLAIKEVYEIAKEGAAFQRMEEASASLARSLSADMSDILDALREASLGMVSDFDLMQAASRAMMLGVSADSEQLAQLMEVAALRGRAMGISTTQAFNDIVTGIGRASPMILDNLGIVIDAEGKYQAYAEAVGKTAEELTKQEKTQALLNGVLESSQGLLEETGGLTMDTAGSFERLEASAKNLSDNLKKKLAPAVALVADGLADMLDTINDTVEGNALYNIADAVDALTLAFYNGTITETEYNTLLTQIHQGYITSAEAVAMVTPEIEAVTQAQLDNIDAIFVASVSWEDFQAKMAAAGLDLGLIDEELYNSEKANYAVADAAKQAAADTALASGNYEEYGKILGLTEEQLKAVRAEQERLAKIQIEIASVTSLTSNYKGIIDLGYKYTDMLAEIEANNAELAEMTPWQREHSDRAKELIQTNEDIEASMAEMADRVVLDMLQATIAIGGVTSAELSAYMDMAIEMGLMSQGGADAAISAYSTAIETINKLEIDDKTGNVIIDTVAAYAAFDALERYQLLDKEMRVFVKYYSQMPSNWYSRNYEEAVGGAVQGGEPYTWQEYGYRGELFVPSADGFIMSRADAERALSKALAGGVSGKDIDADEIGRAIADALMRAGVNKNGNVYNLTMPTSSNPADVKTAFELMEAWA